MYTYGRGRAEKEAMGQVSGLGRGAAKIHGSKDQWQQRSMVTKINGSKDQWQQKSMAANINGSKINGSQGQWRQRSTEKFANTQRFERFSIQYLFCLAKQWVM